MAQDIDLSLANGPVQTQESGDERKLGFFRRIAFLRLNDEDKNDVASKILEDVYPVKLYFIQLFFSSIIAVLGLLTNSTAVVIGAMLIAPLFQPIQGLAFAITTGNHKLYGRAGGLLFYSICLSICVSAVFAYIVPFTVVTQEIFVRTSPTLLDLLIAFASGTIAILSLGFNRLSSSIAGVAMSVSLIPPLCVTGIGLAWLDFDIAWGSFLLFLANLVAIIVVALLIFYAFGFSPTSKEGQKNSLNQVLLFILTTAIVAFPLYTGLQTMTRDISINSAINEAVSTILPSVHTNANLDKYSYEVDNGNLLVDMAIQVPDYSQFTLQNKADIIQYIASLVDMPVSLTLTIIPITSVYVDKPDSLTEDEVVKNIIKKYVQANDSLYLLDVGVNNENPNPLVSVELYSKTVPVVSKIKEDLLQQLSGSFGTRPLFLVLDVKTTPTEKRNESGTGEILVDVLSRQFGLLFEDSVLHQIKAEQRSKLQPTSNGSELSFSGTNVEDLVGQKDFLQIDLDIESSLSTDELQSIFDQWKSLLEVDYGPVEFAVKIQEIKKLIVD